MNNDFDEQIKSQSHFIELVSPRAHWSRGVFITMEAPLINNGNILGQQIVGFIPEDFRPG